MALTRRVLVTTPLLFHGCGFEAIALEVPLLVVPASAGVRGDALMSRRRTRSSSPRCGHRYLKIFTRAERELLSLPPLWGRVGVGGKRQLKSPPPSWPSPIEGEGIGVLRRIARRLDLCRYRWSMGAGRGTGWRSRAGSAHRPPNKTGTGFFSLPPFVRGGKGASLSENTARCLSLFCQARYFLSPFY